MNGLGEDTSIYIQIARTLERDILRGILKEGERVPSSNELARAYTINPATAAKGLNLLVDAGILYKKRGLGMFIAEGARARLAAERQHEFLERFIQPMVREAKMLGISPKELSQLLADSLTAWEENGR